MIYTQLTQVIIQIQFNQIVKEFNNVSKKMNLHSVCKYRIAFTILITQKYSLISKSIIIRLRINYNNHKFHLKQINFKKKTL